MQSHSSSRKRQRLSSPAYDQDILELSQEDLAQLDQIEAQFNQASKSASREARERRTREIEKALRAASPVCSANSKPLQGPDDDAENPFGSNSKQNGFAASSGVSGFASASAFRPASKVPDVSQARSRSPSPENLPEPDYSSWFDPDATANTTLPLFQTAKATMSPIPAQNTGFVKLSDRSFIAPSESALKKAQEKMKAWQEDDPLPPQVAHSPLASQPADSLASNHAPSSPSPAVFNRASALHAPGVLGDLDSNREDSLAKVKAFKSPLLAKQLKPLLTSGTGYTSSPLNPHRPAPTAFASASHHPLASTPARPSVGIHRGIASGSARATSGKPKFATPFKPGMRPGDPGRAALEKGKEKERIRQPPLPPTPCGNARPKESSGNLAIADRTEHGAELKQRTCPQTTRRNLKSSGLTPQAHTVDELEGLGINASELSQITPTLAIYYSFHTRSASPAVACDSDQAPEILGSAAALSELHQRGCMLATKEWVDNHWSMILWKLAGMVMLDPDRETEEDGDSKRWCWGEVIRQLLYRYQRELHDAQRPPLRLITTQDAPASSHLVLCVSGITWSEVGRTDDGKKIEPHPELEVTDGWYRLRAQIDEPLARAVRRGIIRVGRKIGVVGARLSNERKEPLEVLEAYNSTKLVISGNSSHLAPWHVKLGFQSGFAPVCTMNKLTPDGGAVGVMDLTVLKAYPVAFLEFVEEESGEKRREGPWNEKEEARLMDKWRARRQVEESKLRVVVDKKMYRMQGWAERLDRKAGPRFKPTDDESAPDRIERMYDQLEDASDAEVARTFTRLGATDAGWLARYIRDAIIKEREHAGYEIERELMHACPPREVRDFRILLVRDADAHRRPAHRKAQITVWGALGLAESAEGQGGGFREDQRFRVTNLMPTQRSAWMGREEGAEIYLTTRKDSRWTRIQ